jgi:hypothetical protein
MTDVRRVAGRTLITVVALAIVLPVAALATVAIWFSIVTRPLDVPKAARAADVTKAHRTTAALVDDRLNAVVAAAPGPSALATSVRDGCGNDGPAFFGQRGSLACSRTVVRYLAVNGDLGTLQRAWEKRLTSAGWRRDESYPAGGPQGLGYLPPLGDRPQVGINWTERPGPPPTVGDPYFDEVKLDDQSVDRTATYQHAYAHYRYVVAVTVSVQYYPMSRAASPTPPPSLDNVPHCFNGHDCPGG